MFFHFDRIASYKQVLCKLRITIEDGVSLLHHKNYGSYIFYEKGSYI